MVAWYNEIDPYAAQWLRNLIAAGEIAPGVVDERSIVDVRPEELDQYAQCHFFAGLGIWSYALRRAGWSDDRRIWTGSCPCQPFSAAGKGGGFDDKRHLWPHFHWLISRCRPDLVLGEQVASKDGLAWVDLVQADLEGSGYASGAVDFCAASLGSPNIRQRLYWFGERLADSDRPVAELASWARTRSAEADGSGSRGEPDGRSDARGLGDAQSAGRRERPVNVFGTPEADEGTLAGQGHGDAARAAGADGRLVDADRSRAGAQPGDHREAGAEAAGDLRADDGSAVQRGAGATGGLALADDAERWSDLSGRDDRDGRNAGRAEGSGDVGTGRETSRLDDAATARSVGEIGDAERIARHEAWLRLSGSGCENGGLADAGRAGDERLRRSGNSPGTSGTASGQAQERERSGLADRANGASGGVEHLPSDGRIERRTEPSGRGAACGRGDGRMAEPDSAGLFAGRRDDPTAGYGHPLAAAGEHGRLADADGGDAGSARQQRSGEQRQQPQDGRDVHHGRPGPVNGFWRDADWLFCRDARWRAVEPFSFPLVDGYSGRMGQVRSDWRAPAGEEGFAHRVGRLRGYGNAINAEAAVAFIEAFLEARYPERFIDLIAEECVRLKPHNVFD